MKKLSLITILLIVMVMIFSSFSIAFAQDFKVGLVVMSTSSEYWLSVKAGAEKALEQVDGELIYTGPATTAEVSVQVNSVQNLITRGVDGIIVTPLDSDALVPPAKTAIENDIPFVCVDSGINWDGYTSTISTDNVEGGRVAMDKLLDLIGHEGKVVIINSPAGIPSNAARNKGAQKALEDEDNVELLQIQRGKDQAAALDNMQNVLTAHPDVDGVFAAFDRGAIGAARALKNRGMEGKVKFVAYDASPEEIDLLKEGTIDALVVQQPYEMGRLAVEHIIKTQNGEEISEVVNTPVVVVTKENMDTEKSQSVLYPTK